MRINKEKILTTAEYPICIDSFACNFALKIDEATKGNNENAKICKLKIPSWNCGNNSFTKIGESITTAETKNIVNKIVIKINFLCVVFPLDSSDSKKL